MAFRRLEIYTHSLPTEHDFFSERSIGSEPAERSDIFAFGVLLYELLAGVHPFTRSSQSGTLSAILHESPVPSFASSSARAFDKADATRPAGTDTIPRPIIKTKNVKSFPPAVTG